MDDIIRLKDQLLFQNGKNNRRNTRRKSILCDWGWSKKKEPFSGWKSKNNGCFPILIQSKRWGTHHHRRRETSSKLMKRTANGYSFLLLNMLVSSTSISVYPIDADRGVEITAKVKKIQRWTSYSIDIISAIDSTVIMSRENF